MVTGRNALAGIVGQPQKEGDSMSEREKQIAENLADAISRLPDNKKEFLLGYAEGVAAMADKAKEAAEKAAEKAAESEKDDKG